MALKLHAEAVAFVAENRNLFRERWDALTTPMLKRATGEISIDDLLPDLERRCPGFPDPIYRTLMQSIFLWYHLK